jgi:hypothetical protein
LKWLVEVDRLEGECVLVAIVVRAFFEGRGRVEGESDLELAVEGVRDEEDRITLVIVQ